MALARRSALLVTSLGNPPPLEATRHSAGHILLRALSLHLRTPPFQRSKPHAGGLLTRSGDLTLWQSPARMNVSGPAVLSAWKTFVRDHGGGAASADGVGLGLVVLHDELEAAPGTLRVRHGMSDSIKGHNGLKSVFKSLKGPGLAKGSEARLMRVGVGIGRPPGGGRGSDQVSQYVLGKVMVGGEMEGIEALAGKLVAELEEESRIIAKAE